MNRQFFSNNPVFDGASLAYQDTDIDLPIRADNLLPDYLADPTTYSHDFLKGTATFGLVDSDIVYRSFTDIYDSYLKLLEFEDKYKKTSKDFYSEWVEGLGLSSDMSDWLNLYLKLWNKIN